MLNLTPHEIVIRHEDGSETTIPPETTPARVVMKEIVLGTYTMNGHKVPVIKTVPVEITGVPDDAHTSIIVSGMVREALKGRPNTFSPDTGPSALRNEKGHIVAVTRLITA